jgi:hypothetical protein
VELLNNEVTWGRLYRKDTFDVDTAAPLVIVAGCDAPLPAGDVHERDESDVQVVESHSAEPKRTLNLDAGGWNCPKLAPESVTRNPPRRTPSGGVNEETDGKSYEKAPSGTEINLPPMSILKFVRATGARLVGGRATTREESDTHVTFAGVPLTNMDDDVLKYVGL